MSGDEGCIVAVDHAPGTIPHIDSGKRRGVCIRIEVLPLQKGRGDACKGCPMPHDEDSAIRLPKHQLNRTAESPEGLLDDFRKFRVDHEW